MNKNSRGLTAQQIISAQPMCVRPGEVFYLDFSYGSNTTSDLIDLEKAFEQGQTMTMRNFKDGDIVQVVDQNGNIVDTGMYFGKKRINNIHHWLILGGKGYRELNTSFHTLIKTEPIEENK
jgi:hypothetical protein